MARSLCRENHLMLWTNLTEQIFPYVDSSVQNWIYLSHDIASSSSNAAKETISPVANSSDPPMCLIHLFPLLCLKYILILVSSQSVGNSESQIPTDNVSSPWPRKPTRTVMPPIYLKDYHCLSLPTSASTSVVLLQLILRSPCLHSILISYLKASICDHHIWDNTMISKLDSGFCRFIKGDKSLFVACHVVGTTYI